MDNGNKVNSLRHLVSSVPATNVTFSVVLNEDANDIMTAKLEEFPPLKRSELARLAINYAFQDDEFWEVIGQLTHKKTLVEKS